MQYIRLVSIMIVVTAIAIACTRIQDAPASCPSLPSLPQGAEKIVTGKDDRARELTTFQTIQSPNIVLAYYRDALPRSGWKLVLEKNEGDRFSYPSIDEQGPCVVDVLTSKAIDGHTKVVVSVIANVTTY